ncbi:MAG: DUF6314 family protein [Waddliaceae bacterium]
MNIFRALEGKWNFHRTISNYGIIRGVATFKKSAIESHLLHYREEGVLKRENGEHFQVYRDYLYRYKNNRISVFFPEKTERLLHVLEFLDATTAVARHVCSCDVYDATYNFSLEDEFELSYLVNGPSKGYLITTFFTRQLKG